MFKYFPHSDYDVGTFFLAHIQVHVLSTEVYSFPICRVLPMLHPRNLIMHDAAAAMVVRLYWDPADVQ